MAAIDLMDSPGDMLTAAQIASVLGSNPDTIRYEAKMGTLPFPCVWVGNRVKFPKLAFLRWMGVYDLWNQQNGGQEKCIRLK